MRADVIAYSWLILLRITPIESGYLGAAIKHFFILPKCALGTLNSVGCDSVEVIGVLWCPDFIEDTGVLRHTLCTLGVVILQGAQVIFQIAYVTWGS